MSMSVQIEEYEIAKAINWGELDLTAVLLAMADHTSAEEVGDLLDIQITQMIDDHVTTKRPKLTAFLKKVQEAAQDLAKAEGETP
jgi:hypothetical protein